jgi:amino acid adenylation domain-containing protein
VNGLLQGYAARAAARQPDSTALVMGEERVSYGELEERSNRLARLLTERGCRPGDRVVLACSKSPAAIVAMHAVLKAGAAYVPIDVASPAARVDKILRAAEPRLLLADASAAGLVDELRPDASVLSVDEDASAHSAEPLDPPVGADDTAHILFTSGSTGTPKGVVITHRMVTAFVQWAVGHFGTMGDDRISGHPPLHFDLSTFDIYATLSAGAELHLVPADLSLNPRSLAAMIRDADLTQWFSVPSVFTYMAKFDAVKQHDFPHLERVLWCGEVLPTPVLMYWMKRLPHVTFTNLYGPTEATIASSYYEVPELPADETQPIPIGRACDGEELRVLDEQLRPVPAGEIGDLYIGGAGLSPGYWRDEEKTAAAFLTDSRGERIYRTGDLAEVDASGVFHFLGRADSQIKSRGYRIELGEVETALNAIAALRECAVVGLDTGGFEGTAICCAYAADGPIEPLELRKRLQEALPTYMLPTRWMALEELPKNVNGKIDRRALRERFATKAEQAVA